MFFFFFFSPCVSINHDIARLENKMHECNLNFFSTETLFYLAFLVRLDDFIDIRKGLWRKEG